MNQIEIDLKKISENIGVIKQGLTNQTKLFAVVKANAYGHGLVEVAKNALQSGADGLVAFSPQEGIALRRAGIEAPVFLVGFTDPEHIEAVIENNIVATVVSLGQAEKISEIAVRLSQTALLDLKVETGMNRFGFSAEELIRDYAAIRKLPNVKIAGMHSHFADALNSDYSKEQIEQLKRVLSAIEFGDDRPLVHLCATDSAYLYPEAHFGAVRIGIGMYGYCDSPQLKKLLQPALGLKSNIAQLKKIKKGESVSYRRTFIAEDDMSVAILPIGYADGLPRALSNVGQVLIAGQRAAIVGRICMNVTIIDVTKIDCQEGDEVVLIGQSGDDKIDAADIAKLIDTNPHEILTGLSEFLPRKYI
jgi:alanine racemase